jgi:hypothetical protein
MLYEKESNMTEFIRHSLVHQNNDVKILQYENFQF